jgi:hypothetical protein
VGASCIGIRYVGVSVDTLLCMGVMMQEMMLMMQIEEMIELNRKLKAIATQVIDDVEDMAKTGDHATFYERMVANAQDFETALQIQKIGG